MHLYSRVRATYSSTHLPALQSISLSVQPSIHPFPIQIVKFRFQNLDLENVHIIYAHKWFRQHRNCMFLKVQENLLMWQSGPYAFLGDKVLIAFHVSLVLVAISGRLSLPESMLVICIFLENNLFIWDLKMPCFELYICPYYYLCFVCFLIYYTK